MRLRSSQPAAATQQLPEMIGDGIFTQIGGQREHAQVTGVGRALLGSGSHPSISEATPTGGYMHAPVIE